MFLSLLHVFFILSEKLMKSVSFAYRLFLPWEKSTLKSLQDILPLLFLPLTCLTPSGTLSNGSLPSYFEIQTGRVNSVNSQI